MSYETKRNLAISVLVSSSTKSSSSQKLLLDLSLPQIPIFLPTRRGLLAGAGCRSPARVAQLIQHAARHLPQQQQKRIPTFNLPQKWNEAEKLPYPTEMWARNPLHSSHVLYLLSCVTRQEPSEAHDTFTASQSQDKSPNRQWLQGFFLSQGTTTVTPATPQGSNWNVEIKLVGR